MAQTTVCCYLVVLDYYEKGANIGSAAFVFVKY